MAGDIGLHSGKPWWFYLQEMNDANPLLILVLIAAAVVLFQALVSRDSHSLLILCWIAAIYIPITFSAVKLSWYAIPLFPPLALCTAVAADRILHNKRKNRTMVFLVSGISLVMAGSGYYNFQRHQVARFSKEDTLAQLRELLVQFHSCSAPRDILHDYEIGEAVSLTSFYADRRVQYLFGSKDTVAVYRKIPSDYLGKGIVRLVPDIGSLESVMRQEGGFFLLQRNLYPALEQDKIPCSVVSRSRDFIIAACAIPAGVRNAVLTN
jgi:hypothetical protein